MPRKTTNIKAQPPEQIEPTPKKAKAVKTATGAEPPRAKPVPRRSRATTKAEVPTLAAIVKKAGSAKVAAKAPAATKAKGSAKAKSGTASKKNVDIRLFQVSTNDGAEGVQEDVFEAFNLQGGRLPLVDGMLRLRLDPAVQASRLWGLLPTDFAQRTALSGSALRVLIASNPGYDCYFCDVHPELEAIHYNPWRQAEASNPNFIALSREFLKAAGLSDAPVDTLGHSSLFATGHLIVASPLFWSDYLSFIERILAQVEKKIGKTAKAALFDEVPREGKYSYLYLIVARLLGVFLMMKDSTWRVCKLPLPAQEMSLNPHLRLLREMKDLAVSQKSQWMTSCWANYRSLYLVQTMGQGWITSHFAAINPGKPTLAVPTAQVVYAYPRTTDKKSS